MRTRSALLLLSALAGCTLTGPGDGLVTVSGARGEGSFTLDCPAGEIAYTEELPARNLVAAPRLAVGGRVGDVTLVSALVPAELDLQGGVRLTGPGRLTLLDLADDGALRDLLVVSAEEPTRLQVVKLVEETDAWDGGTSQRSTSISRLEVVLPRQPFTLDAHGPVDVALDTALFAADGAPLCGKLPWQATLEPEIGQLARPDGDEGRLLLHFEAPGQAELRLEVAGLSVVLPVEVRR